MGTGGPHGQAAPAVAGVSNPLQAMGGNRECNMVAVRTESMITHERAPETLSGRRGVGKGASNIF